ncbi:translocation protein TolB [Fibrobacteria bacterium R8-3-H12]
MIRTAFLLPALAFAAFYGNQSAINWKSAETEHFLAHYPVEYRERAATAMSFAENVYDTITTRYKIKLPSKVNLVFSNGLFSNGEANPVYNMMQISLTNWDFKIRGSHTWISDVITHEFSHLASIQNASKTPMPWIQGLQISKSDFLNEKKQLAIGAYIPFTIMPLWFAEGTAQFESYRMGFDRWDTHRDMLLRTAFLENKVLPLEFMDSFSEQSLEAEQGPYTQGFDMVRYIAETYGEGAIPELWKDMSKLSNWTLSGALSERFNITEKELYKKWRENRKEHYEKVRSSAGEIKMGKKISDSSFYHEFISVANGNLYGLSNFKGDFFDGDIFEYKDSTPKKFEKFKLKKPFLSQGMNVKQTPKGLLSAYVTYQNRDKNGKPYFDIAIADTSGKSHIVTKFADAVYPDLSPDGKQVVFARREANGTRFYLSIANTDSLSDYKDIVAPQGTEFNVYNPKFSPDGKKIAFSYFDGTKRKIGIFENESWKSLNPENPGSDKRDPSWSADGKSLYYSSDETGIFNICKKNLETGETKKITNVLGGAFSPIEKKDSIFYIGYDRDGFSIYEKLSEPGFTGLEDLQDVENNYQPYIKESNEISFANSERSYIPIPRMPILVPLFAFEDRSPDFGAVNAGIMVPKAGLAFGLNDPLNKNFFEMAVLQEIGKFGEDSQSDLLASLENRSFPITLNLGFTRSNTVSKDTVRYEAFPDSLGTSEYASELYNALLSASYSLFKIEDTLTIFTSYDWESFNLYQDLFKWDYHKRWRAGLIASLAIADSLLSLQGLYSFSKSDLFRPGTFAESFTVSESGAIIPHYRRFYLQEWAGSAKIKISKFSLSLFGGGLLDWKSKDSDTLDNFYLHPLVIDGYPILKNSESYFRQGTRTFLAEFSYKYTIYEEFRKRFGIFTTRNFNVSPYVQMGSVWNNWLRSFGINWRMENILFYTAPFNLNFGVARGLDEPKDVRIKIGVGVM